MADDVASTICPAATYGHPRPEVVPDAVIADMIRSVGLPEFYAVNLGFMCGVQGANVRLVDRCLMVGR